MNNLVELANRFFGTPYIWGGKSGTALHGLDCSGLICEVLRSYGLIPYTAELSAQGIYDYFEKDPKVRSQLSEGSLLFFGKSRKEITHVGLAIDSAMMIECGGGDHTTTTLLEATHRNAYVRYRRIDHRSDLQAVLKVEGKYEIPV